MGYTALVLPMEFDPGRRCRTSVYWKSPETGERIRFADPRVDKGELLLPERFPREVVDADKVQMGPMMAEAQMQQNPTPLEGAVFKNLGKRRWSKIPEGCKYIITVDCAFKATASSDFVAIQAWASKGTNYYLLDQLHDRMNLGRTMSAIKIMAERWPYAAIHIEDKANGPAVIEMLTGTLAGVQAWSPGMDSKESRANAVAHLFDTNVFLPPDEEAPWIGAYLAEMGKFPLTKHDDQVDATTMALLLLHKPQAQKYVDAWGSVKL